MLYKITDILKGQIESKSLSYIDVLAGLTDVDHVNKQVSSNSLIQKIYPTYCGLTDGCDGKQLLPLIPDKKLKSLFYFEDLRGITVVNTDRGFVNYTGYVRLIAWLNPKLLGSNDCSITAPIMTEIISILQSKTFNSGDFAKIRTRILNIPTKSETLFSKYKYSPNFIDILDKPYDYFALDIAIDFSIHTSCITKFTANTPIEC